MSVECRLYAARENGAAMAVWASRAYLRWYKSFNTATTDPIDSSSRPWDTFDEEQHRFVEVPLSPRVCTIVGANETGKSHLLGAIEKVLSGVATTATGEAAPYSSHDICRYSGMLTVAQDLWPELGLEFTYDDRTERDSSVSALGFGNKVAGLPGNSLRVIVRGGSDEQYATLYSAEDQLIGTLARDAWHENAKSLPACYFVRSNLAFSNFIHIDQLIGQYKKQTAKAFDPLALQDLATTLLDFDVSTAAAEQVAFNQDNNAKRPTIDALVKLKRALEKSAIRQPDRSLERILFEDIIGVPLSTLKTIRSLGTTQNGYVEQLLADINHKLVETLDIAEYWQQDEDFSLQIDYKGGIFYFFILDRTGAKYTFDERSGGLKHFLSYYVQSKAIRDRISDRGAIIVMDEPDGFLSAAGQRNLLSVFELLAQPIGNGATARRCQVIYSTHSPFLINRNYPDRITLVRKGDGGEGTQVVDRLTTNQYEPIRSGLGVESGDTLFMGVQNVVLEGVSEQRILSSAIQRFGDPHRIDDMLDLNRVTLVSASGVWDIERLLRATRKSKEKKPATVILVDGDASGRRALAELAENSLIPKQLTSTLSDAGLPTDAWCESPETLEDIIPPALLAHAAYGYAKSRWAESRKALAELTISWSSNDGEKGAERFLRVIREACGPVADSVTDIELKAGVYEVLAGFLSDRSNTQFEQDKEALNELETVMRALCNRLDTMLAMARTVTRQAGLRKSVTLEVERFSKLHGRKATKADVRRCLNRIEVLPVGADGIAKGVRERVRDLQQLNDDEVKHAGYPVDASQWTDRLNDLADTMDASQ